MVIWDGSQPTPSWKSGSKSLNSSDLDGRKMRSSNENRTAGRCSPRLLVNSIIETRRHPPQSWGSREPSLQYSQKRAQSEVLHLQHGTSSALPMQWLSPLLMQRDYSGSSPYGCTDNPRSMLHKSKTQ